MCDEVRACGGGIMSLLTLALSGVITKFMKFEMAAYALRVLSPAIFIYAVVGVLRGFFQGHETMMPTAVSQVIEQIVNAVVSVGGAALLIGYGTELGREKGNDSLGPAFGAAGGTLGTVVSVTVALLFLLFIYVSYQRSPRQMRRDHTKGWNPTRSFTGTDCNDSSGYPEYGNLQHQYDY